VNGYSAIVALALIEAAARTYQVHAARKTTEARANARQQ
jgi:hypothetical protein